MHGTATRLLAISVFLSLLVALAAAPTRSGSIAAGAGAGEEGSDREVAEATAESTTEHDSANGSEFGEPATTEETFDENNASIDATVGGVDATSDAGDGSLVVAGAGSQSDTPNEPVEPVVSAVPVVPNEPVAEPIPSDGEVDALIASGAIPPLSGSDLRVLIDQLRTYFPEEMEGVEVGIGGGAAGNPFLQVRAAQARMTCFDLVAFVVDGSRSTSTVIHQGPQYRGGPTVYRVTTTGVMVSGFVLSFNPAVSVRPLAGSATYGFWNHTQKAVAPTTLLISVNGGRGGPRFGLSFPSSFTLRTVPGGGLNPLSFSAPGSFLLPAQTFSNATNQGFYLFRDGTTQVNGVIVARIERPC